jgi:glutamyl-tRNA reductase
VKLDLVGLSWRRADLATRERAAVGAASMAVATSRVLAAPAMEGVVILSTCKRTEIYLSPSLHLEEEALRTIFADAVGLDPREDLPCFVLRDREAAAHLFRVTSGLDSPNLGEVQVLAQVRRAWESSRDLGHSCAFLNGLFLRALECGRRARHESGLSRRCTSVAGDRIAAVLQILGPIDGRHVLLVGAGQTARSALQKLQDAGRPDLRFSNRSQDAAFRLAVAHGGETCPFPPRVEEIAWADLVVSATGASGVVLGASLVLSAVERREGPLFLLDLAVPRDIDPALDGHPAIHLLTVDHAGGEPEANQAADVAVAKAERVVEALLDRFDRWYRESRVAPGLGQVKATLERIRQAEIQACVHRFAPEDRNALDRFSRALVKRVAATLASNLKLAGKGSDDLELAMALARVFSEDAGDVAPTLERMRHELAH